MMHCIFYTSCDILLAQQQDAVFPATLPDRYNTDILCKKKPLPSETMCATIAVIHTVSIVPKKEENESIAHAAPRSFALTISRASSSLTSRPSSAAAVSAASRFTTSRS